MVAIAEMIVIRVIGEVDTEHVELDQRLREELEDGRRAEAGLVRAGTRQARTMLALIRSPLSLPEPDGDVVDRRRRSDDHPDRLDERPCPATGRPASRSRPTRRCPRARCREPPSPAVAAGRVRRPASLGHGSRTGSASRRRPFGSPRAVDGVRRSRWSRIDVVDLRASTPDGRARRSRPASRPARTARAPAASSHGWPRTETMQHAEQHDLDQVRAERRGQGQLVVQLPGRGDRQRRPGRRTPRRSPAPTAHPGGGPAVPQQPGGRHPGGGEHRRGDRPVPQVAEVPRRRRRRGRRRARRGRRIGRRRSAGRAGGGTVTTAAAARPQAGARWTARSADRGQRRRPPTARRAGRSDDRHRHPAEGEQRRPEVHEQHRAAVRVADLQQPVVQVHLVRRERRAAGLDPAEHGQHQVDERAPRAPRAAAAAAGTAGRC